MAEAIGKTQEAGGSRELILLATGGTISMQRSPSAGGNVPALDGPGLLALAGGRDLGPIRVEDWERLPAVHRGPAQMWALRTRIAELLAARPAPLGIVVTHGTDTLEELAYLLARTLAPEIPVVLTGAMRTSSDEGWDGPSNLGDAIRVARNVGSRDRGVLAVFAGRILDGLDTAKLHTSDPDAFRSVNRPELGSVTDGLVRYDRPAARRRPPLRATGCSARVALVPLALGDDGTLLDLARPRFDGVVLEAFGRGNVPPGALPAIRRWLTDGKPVVLASRCRLGEVGGEYAFEGGGGQLLRLGVIPAGPRTSALARLELALALSAGTAYGADE